MSFHFESGTWGIWFQTEQFSVKLKEFYCSPRIIGFGYPFTPEPYNQMVPGNHTGFGYGSPGLFVVFYREYLSYMDTGFFNGWPL